MSPISRVVQLSWAGVRHVGEVHGGLSDLKPIMTMAKMTAGTSWRMAKTMALGVAAVSRWPWPKTTPPRAAPSMASAPADMWASAVGAAQRSAQGDATAAAASPWREPDAAEPPSWERVQQLLHSWEHLNALLLGDCQALVKKPGPGATQLVAAAAEMVNALQAAGKSVKAVGKIGRQRSAQLQYEQEQRQRDKEAAVRSHCRTTAAAQLWLGSR